MTVDGGGNALLLYVVAVTPDGFEDSNHELLGSVKIENRNEFTDAYVTVEQTVSFEGLHL